MDQAGFDEPAFQRWYAERAQRLGLDPNPDDPQHFYDYRAAYRAGAEPGPDGHWPSAFKREGHPRMIVDGVNTKTGEPVNGVNLTDDELRAAVREGWLEGPDGPATLNKLDSDSRRRLTKIRAEAGQTGGREFSDRDLMTILNDTRTTNEDIAALNPADYARLEILAGQKPKRRSLTDVAVDALPMIGGAVYGTAAKLPIVGTAFAGLGGAAGEGYRQVAESLRGNFQNVPETASDRIKAMAIAGAEQAGLEGAGRAVMAGVTPAAKAVYRGYLKPSLSKINVAKASEIVDTAFREALPVTADAVSKAGRRIGELKARVDQMLANHSGTVNLTDIADQVRSWARTMYNRAGRAPEDLKAALDVADRIDAHPSIPQNPFWPQQPVTATMEAANDTKRALQEGVYGVKGGAQRETEKYAARLTRQEIERQAPDVGPLNMRESKLIDLARSLRQATAREGNQDRLIGAKTLASGLLGGESYRRTGDPYSAAALALGTRLALTPAMATRAAVLAGRMAERVPGTALADVARAAVQAVLEGSSASQDAYQTR